MQDKLDKDQLIRLVEKIMRSEGTLEELEAWLRIVEENVPDPQVSDLIYWPEQNGLGETPTAEHIVERALQYKSIQL